MRPRAAAAAIGPITIGAIVIGAIAIGAITIACRSGFFQQYEYEEDLYLSLDGTATLYVNSSLDALNALRGTAFDVGFDATFDRAALGTYFTTSSTRVTRMTTSERNGRVFAHVRMDVDDVRKLGDVEPFDWSTYELGREGDLIVFRQRVGSPRTASAADRVGGAAIVAFRIHAPSRVVYHNAGAGNLRRGNILVWEQPLAERFRGTPIEVDVRMEPESILHQTLWLFGASAAAVVALFGGVIWWLTRRPRAST
jgi:hypothetical protein